MKNLAPIFILLICSFISNAQIKIITLSPHDFTVDKSAPFDEPFILRVPYKDSPFIKLRYFELAPRHDIWGTIVKKSLKDVKMKTNTVENIFTTLFPTKRKYYTLDKQKYTYFYFTSPNLLKPGKRYGIILHKKNSYELVDFLSDFNNINTKFFTKSDRDIFKKKYKSLLKGKVGTTKGKQIEIYYGRINPKNLDSKEFRDSIKNYINKNVKKEISEIDNLKTKFDQHVKNAIGKLNTKSILNYPVIKDHEHALLESGVYFKDITPFNSFLKWWNIDKSQNELNNIFIGKKSILDRDTLTNTNLDKYIINVLKSLTFCESVYPKINYLNKNYKQYSNISNELDLLIIFLEHSLVLLKQKKTTYAKIIKKINSKPLIYKLLNEDERTLYFSNIMVHEIDSYLGSFETRKNFMISPDLSFGMLNPFNLKKDSHKGLNYRYFPNIGFSINLKPINKDVKYGSYDKSLLQKLTIDAGWSLVDFSKEDEYDNFFESSTFYTGIGIRLNNIVRTQAGMQWLNVISSDTSRKIERIPFVGISIDLSVKDLLNGFNDVLLGLKGPVIQPEIQESETTD